MNKNNNYFDQVQYTNVFSDTLLLILTKEGTKILKVINDLLVNICVKNDTRNITEIKFHSIRAQLHMFYILYNEFISRKFEYLFLLNTNVFMTPFKNDTESMLNRLMITNSKNTEDFKNKLCENLILPFDSLIPLIVIHGDKSDKHYFDEYYLTSPILDIHKILINLNMMFYEYL